MKEHINQVPEDVGLEEVASVRLADATGAKRLVLVTAVLTGI